MPHVMNSTSLTSWKVKEEGKSSAHATCSESNVAYLLGGEEGSQIVRQHRMG